MTYSSHPCPSCGAHLESTAPAGLCPRCLMAGALLPTDSVPPVNPCTPPEVGQVATAFPQLEVQAFIGAGGMGAVFRARQPKLNRLVALKVLPASLAQRDQAFAARFEREGQLLARLHHPNIVAVYDSGLAGEYFYLLMEYVDGVNLRQAMQAGRFTPEQALILVPQICNALQYAHEEGVLHRDIKPENILLDSKGRVKLADFGIGKIIGEREFPAAHANEANASLTQAGAALGTPAYMAPEQRDQPNQVDHRADIYSLGVVFYELLTGKLPAGNFSPPSALAASDPKINAIVRQALEKERDRRQQSAAEMRTQVETLTAASSQSSSAAGVNPPLKKGLGRFATPEFLQSFLGGLKRHEGSGELSLHYDRLCFAQGWNRREIPLSAIRHTGLAILPWWISPAAHRYLSVVYDEEGRTKQILFMPGNAWFATTRESEQRAAEWLVSLRTAIRAATGREASLGDDFSPARIPASPFGSLAVLLIWIVPLLLLYPALAAWSGGIALSGLKWLFITALLAFCFRPSFFSSEGNRGRLSLPHDLAPPPPAPPWMRNIGIFFLLGQSAVILMALIGPLAESGSADDSHTFTIDFLALGTLFAGIALVGRSAYARKFALAFNLIRLGFFTLSSFDSSSLKIYISGHPWAPLSLALAAASTVVLLRRDVRFATLPTAPSPEAMAAADAWLQQVDQGAYRETWRMAADPFQQAVSEANWVAKLDKLRRPLGAPVARKLKTVRQTPKLPGMRRGSYFLARFDTRLEGMAQAVESVVFSLDQDGQWKAAGYLIRPREMPCRSAPHWEAYANAAPKVDPGWVWRMIWIALALNLVAAPLLRNALLKARYAVRAPATTRELTLPPKSASSP